MADDMETDLSPENLQRFFDANANEAAAGAAPPELEPEPEVHPMPQSPEDGYQNTEQPASLELTGADRYRALLSTEDRRLAEQLEWGRTRTPAPSAQHFLESGANGDQNRLHADKYLSDAREETAVEDRQPSDFPRPRAMRKQAKQSHKSKTTSAAYSPAGEDIEGAMNLQRLGQPSPPEALASPPSRNNQLLFRPPKEQAVIDRMRKDRALKQAPTHIGTFGTSFLASEAAKKELSTDKQRQTSIAEALKSPAVQRPEHPYFAARNAPLTDTITTTGPVIAQALQHLDNLTRTLRASEQEACDRELELAKMLVRARRVREEATEWRVRGEEAVAHRRAEVQTLAGLEPEELDAVEGWEEILRPLVLRDGRR